MSALRQKTTSDKQRARRYAQLSQRAELSKEALLQKLAQGSYTEKRPSTNEIKRERYYDALRKNPPMENRIDKIAVFFGNDSKKTGGILAQYRKMQKQGLVKIVFIRDEPSQLPYVFETAWLDRQKSSAK